ncbi:beta-lactamase-like protein [Nemania serpens]|nr:beta-lactamase-like protein [Nemania serpens]
MPVSSDQVNLAKPGSRKRSHDEYVDGATATATPSASRDDNDGNSQQVAEAVVAHMFDSDWTPDALVETTLHQAKQPAKLFVRDEKGHLQVYKGPLPGGAEDVPDIPVLVRKPWPGAMITKLPRTDPSKQSMCYIVKGHDRRGRFNPQAAERLGVDKRDYRYLTHMQSVKGKNGIEVTPEMVLGETVPGNGFAVVDLPDTSYIDGLVNRPEWADGQIMRGMRVIFWLLGPGVVNDTRLQDFMRKMSSLKHIVTSTDTCPNMIALESTATQAFKLRCIDPDRFSLPAHSNKQTLLGTDTPTADQSTYEVGRVGKTIKLAPEYMHEDDKIVPFPNLSKLARQDFDDNLLEMAAQTKSKISDPDFIAKVEKAEADIPNRDAEIISLGTGSALPSKYRNVSATLVCVPGHGNYLFDAGENTLGQMHRVFGDELPSVLRNLKVIWISHLHADHHLGTVSVIRAWHEETIKSDPSAKLVIASHGHMIDWLREYSDIENYGFERLVPKTFGRNEYQTRAAESHVFSGEEAEQFGLSKLEACKVNHCYGALAIAFTFSSGLKIAYSGDCRPSDAFVRIGRGATLLIHESTFDDELQGDAIAKKHSTMSEAIDVGRRMGARRILLTHFSQRYQKIPNMEEDFKIPTETNVKDKARADEVVLVAFDYMRLKLGDFRKAQAFLPVIQKLFEGAEQ